jgi:hypothetical protein
MHCSARADGEFAALPRKQLQHRKVGVSVGWYIRGCSHRQAEELRKMRLQQCITFFE